MTRLVLLPLLLLSLLLPRVAFASDIDPDARRHFELGARAYDEARYEEAIDHFMKAYAIDPKPSLLYNAAQGYERLGDIPNALRSYRDYLRLIPQDEDTSTIEARVENLEARLRKRGVQQMTVYSSPAGATVTLDEQQVGQTPWTGLAKPGPHVVIVELDGYGSARKEIRLRPEHALDVDITLSEGVFLNGRPSTPSEQDEASPPPAPEPAEPVVGDRGPEPAVRPWTWVALGLGGAGLAAGLGFELARRGAESDAEGAPDQLAYREHFETMESRQTLARVFTIVGGVATLAGGALLYLDLTREDAPTEARAGIGCATEYCGAVARGRF